MRLTPPARAGARLALRLLAPVLLFAACERSPVKTEPEETSFTFSFRQGDNGAWHSFSAKGLQPPMTSFATPGAWVFAGTASQNVVLRPWQKAGENWQSAHVIVSLRPQADTTLLGDAEAMTCPGTSGRPCTFWTFRTQTAAGATTESCVIVNGEMVRTRNTAQWLSGRFSGTGVCRGNGVQRSFEVRDGEFDIGLPTPAVPPG